ncbi:MAG TPA: hypothetical protein VFT99_14875 [Roseiflexaceae bacterium]|nr:hypothetical protein [Roseiflexaceae bacterium]
MQQSTVEASSLDSMNVPTRDEAHQAALQQLRMVLRRRELVWIVSEKYDAHEIAWMIDVVRSGPMGRWVHQRYRYDAQPRTLHFRGERIIDDAELDAARQRGTEFRASP